MERKELKKNEGKRQEDWGISEMSIPNFQEVMLPVLETVADGNEHKLADLKDRMSDKFNLTEDERQQLLPGGKKVMASRVGWAKTYLKESGLIESVKWGVVRITDSGLKVLASKPEKIDLKYLEQFPSYIEFISKSRKGGGTKPDPPEPTDTPEELIESSYDKLREALASDLLQQVKDCSDKFFERLVVELLVAMGYGGTIEDAGKAVGKSGDGGIDGIIKEDRLGLDVVVIQAKKWDNNPVGRKEVQSFAGSMEGFRARKGVFITTSTFSKPAEEYVKNIGTKIVLIDGEQVANLMIDFDIGVSSYREFVLKRLDSDYFEE